jgi:predicted HicB family RNase H-like nuclease
MDDTIFPRNMMEYKGYRGRITALDDRQNILHGEVVGINDVVTFQGKTSAELVQAFHDSVDDYLAFCEERSEVPEKPYSG